MAEESDHLLRFGIRTLPAIGGVQRSAMLVGGTPFSYGSTSDDGSDTFRNSPAVTSHPIQAEDDGDMERSRVLILPVFKGESGLPNVGIESINSSCIYNRQQTESEVTHSTPNTVPARGKIVGRQHYFVFGALLLAAIIISASLTCAFGVIEVEPGTMRQDSPIYGGDTILLSSANTFWYDEVVVHKAKGNTTDDHQVHLCSVLCDRLVANQRFSNFKSSSRHAIKNVILLEPTYFVSNSVVNITLTVFNVSSPSITLELYIFDRVSNYYAFQHEKTTPSDTIAHKVVGTAGYNPVTTQVLFTVPRTSYYFFGLNTSAPLTFRYSYEYLQLFYGYSNNNSADCAVQDDTNVWSLPLPPSTSIDAPRTCILGYITHTSFGASPIYLTTELHRNLWNPLTITLLVLSTLAWLITCSIFLSLCYCVCVRAGRKHGYTPIEG